MQFKNLRSSSYPALACADIVHVALVRMLIDTHRFSTAVKVLQRIMVCWQSCAFSNNDEIETYLHTVSVGVYIQNLSLNTSGSSSAVHHQVSETGSQSMRKLLHEQSYKYKLNTLCL